MNKSFQKITDSTGEQNEILKALGGLCNNENSRLLV